MARTGQDIAEAARWLQAGELVAIPTETVYGLAANGLDAAAVLKIFTAKQRPHFDPLILHTDTLDKVTALVSDMPAGAQALAEAFWPGPLTLLLNKLPQVPDLVTSGLPRVALRIPAHPLSRELLACLDFPLAAPSANPFGYVSPTTAAHVDAQLGERIAYILDGGPCEIGLESTIIGFQGEQPVVHRLGGLQLEALEAVVGPLLLDINQNDNPAAPGMISSHYAPRKPLYVGEVSVLAERFASRTLGIISLQERYESLAPAASCVLSAAGSVEEAASGLFAALRYLDSADVDVILAERFPEQGLGRAINDRLRRAAVNTGGEH